LYYIAGSTWTAFQKIGVGVAASATGEIIAASNNGNTIATKASSGTVRLWSVDTLKESGEASPTYGIATHPASVSTITPGGTINALAVSFDGTAFIVGTTVDYKIYEYRNLANDWILSKTVSTPTLSVSSCVANVFASLQPATAPIDILIRQNVSGISSVTSDAMQTLLDSQPLSNVPNEQFLTRGTNVSPHRGLTVVQAKILETLKAISVKEADAVKTAPSKISDLGDVTVVGPSDKKAGKFIAFSADRSEWVDDEGWWEDLRFPFNVAQNANTNNPSNTITVGRIIQSPANSCIVYTSAARYDTDPVRDGDVMTVLAQLPHKWLAGTSLHPHIHWVQTNQISPNWLLGMRVIKNGEADTYRTSKLYPSTGSITAEGVSGEITFLRGLNVFPYSSGSLTQITTFWRFNKGTQTFISEGIDASDLTESSMIAFMLFRDKSNATGMFPFNNNTPSPALNIRDERTGTNNNSAAVYEFDVHYRISKVGTAAEYPPEQKIFSAAN
jgi:hypothetical protein